MEPVTYRTYCPRCLSDSEVKILGLVKEVKFKDGTQTFYNDGDLNKILTNLNKRKKDIISEREVPREERLPINDVCKLCQKEIADHTRIVEQGGVFWSCVQCGREGVIKKNEFTEVVRTNLTVPEPELVIVKFHQCDQHKVHV